MFQLKLCLIRFGPPKEYYQLNYPLTGQSIGLYFNILR